MVAVADSTDDPALHLRVESEVHPRIEVGRGSTLLIHGWCFHALKHVRRLRVFVGDEPHRLIAEGMPRADVVNNLPPTIGAGGNAYRSGFWGLIPFSPIEREMTVRLRMEARLAGGEVSSRRIAELELAPGDRFLQPPSSGTPRVAICMATFNPPLELFRRQIDSIREQTHENWTCLISDDDSRPEVFEGMQEIIGGDARFVVSRSPRRVGVYRNFERALSLTPEDADLVALSDQDDRWYPDKVATLRERLTEGTTLVYSDMRITEPDGGVIAPTFWTTRPNNHTDLKALILANTVTGAASLFRRQLLDYILPFPPPAEGSLHDHWIGMVAMSMGKVGYVDRPLYDYVQHAGAVLGHARSNNPHQPLGERRERPADAPSDGEGGRGRLYRLRLLRRRSELRMEVMARLQSIRRDYASLLRVHTSAELLMLRCGRALSRRKRRDLRRCATVERSPLGVGWLSWRLLRSWRRPSATLRVERLLIGGAIWRALLSTIKRLRLPAPAAHRQNLAMVLRLPLSGEPVGAARLHKLIAPLLLDVSANAPERVNLLIPTIDLGHFFGGYIAKFNLARRLAEQGLRVRIVCVDEPYYLSATWRKEIERFEGLEGITDLVEIELAHDRRKALQVNPSDRFIATTWWTAHVAHQATEDLGGGRFLYLIQECEPLTFPMGSWAALARQTYDFPHYALFSTELLRQYFRRHGIGVFAPENGAGDVESVSFENAITPVRPPSEKEMRASDRKLLFYARPEVHAERNMFELGLLGLAEAQEEGLLDGWELHGIGAQQQRNVRYGRGLSIKILPRQEQKDYGELLRGHAVGLSLMLTPHPSLVPLEMAAAGMPVVTNTFENKTRDALSSISENLVAVEPTIEGVKAGLREAVEASADYERRLRGAQVNWSKSWEDSFSPELIGTLQRFIESS